MTKTITAVFDDPGQMTNAFDDLISLGIPRETIFADKQPPVIKVAAPGNAVPEISEVLRRHHPTDVSETPFPAS